MSDPSPLDPSTFLLEHVVPRPAARIADLRSQIARLERELADRLAAAGSVELRLDGENGGTWYLNLSDGEARLAERPDSPPVVRVRQSREDWEALAREQLAGRSGPTPGGDLTRSRIERLRGLDGTLEFRLVIDDERTARVTVQFGQSPPAAARCVLTMRAADARRMQAGELPPQAAFLQGLVRLEGDVAFAMQVGAALFL